ncbi:MAG TPA: peroxiredoxin family protein [Anaerovoracaceae bacterium]|nr:peroxiredoxin family protein [Anaerovoracaceae bacterium]
MKIINKRILFLLVIAISIMSTGYGQELNYSKYGIETIDSHIPQGLKVGDKAPDFSGYDQKGKLVESEKLLEKGPVVLFFYRGKWCPVCSRYLNNYQDSLNIITDQGFNVVAITPESIENVEQTVKMHNLSFTVIYDCQEKIMKDYDVMFNVTKAYQERIFTSLSTDIAKNNGRDAARLPVPATYIINREGIVVAVQFDPDYRNRASVLWILRNLGKAL